MRRHREIHMSHRIFCAVAAFTTGCLLMMGNAWAENRVALVIGNSDYKSVTRLPNPTNDANAITKALQAVETLPSKMRIVILDACRNNPFTTLQKTTGRGLAIVDAPAGSIVAYSTSPGQEALDGTGTNSPYTAALVDVMKEPGLAIEQVFKSVRVRVNKVTEGRQVPW